MRPSRAWAGCGPVPQPCQSRPRPSSSAYTSRSASLAGAPPTPLNVGTPGRDSSGEPRRERDIRPSFRFGGRTDNSLRSTLVATSRSTLRGSIVNPRAQTWLEAGNSRRSERTSAAAIRSVELELLSLGSEYSSESAHSLPSTGSSLTSHAVRSRVRHPRRRTPRANLLTVSAGLCLVHASKGSHRGQQARPTKFGGRRKSVSESYGLRCECWPTRR
jgi:hypothetical protein